MHLCAAFSVTLYMLISDLPAFICTGLCPVCSVPPEDLCVPCCSVNWADRHTNCWLSPESRFRKVFGKCLASIFAGSTHKAIILEVEISLTSWYNLSTCNSWHGWLNHLCLNRQYCEQMVNNLRKVKLWAALRLNFVSFLSYCHRCGLAALNHSRLYSIYKMNFKSFRSKWDKAEFLGLG